MLQTYCEKCGLEYHGVSVKDCRNESPKIGTPAWRNGRNQVMANIYNAQAKLRKYIVEWCGGEEELERMQLKSRADLNEATYAKEEE